MACAEVLLFSERFLILEPINLVLNSPKRLIVLKQRVTFHKPGESESHEH